MITKRMSFLLGFFLMLTIEALALVSYDSTQKSMFPKLTEQIGLKSPKLKTDEYEIRIWNKVALRYGDAQMVYVLRKTNQKLTLIQYVINSNKQGFEYAVKLKPASRPAHDLWERLVQQDILTLADERTIQNQLHPRNRKDSTWNVIEPDGSVSVHAKKKEASIWVSDGERYDFEVFGQDNYRIYGYSNPQSYFRAKPDIAELRRVVAILDEVAACFRGIR